MSSAPPVALVCGGQVGAWARSLISALARVDARLAAPEAPDLFSERPN
jgi:fluoride ion exporter CrcB/FEX